MGLEVLMLVVVVFGALLGSEAWPAVCGCVSCVWLVCAAGVLGSCRVGGGVGLGGGWAGGVLRTG